MALGECILLGMILTRGTDPKKTLCSYFNISNKGMDASLHFENLGWVLFIKHQIPLWIPIFCETYVLQSYQHFIIALKGKPSL